jgi:hypothetical protein
MSLSDSLSLSLSVSEKKRRKKKGRKEIGRRKGNRVSLLFRFSLLTSLFSLKHIYNLSSLTTSSFSHDLPLSETRTETGKGARREK